MTDERKVTQSKANDCNEMSVLVHLVELSSTDLGTRYSALPSLKPRLGLNRFREDAEDGDDSQIRSRVITMHHVRLVP